MTIKELRKERGLQQREVANLLGVTQSYYSMIELGQRKLSVENAKKIGEIYKVDWWLLFMEA